MSEQVEFVFPPFQKHSFTSLEAAREIAGSEETLRRRVYEHLRDCGDRGATDLEMQADLSMIGSTERPRRVRLVELCLIRDSGRTRLTPSGRQSVVWVACEVPA
jgi:hypothetical protein